MDQDGYVYVADTGNHAIRMISPHGTVTTLAGTPGQAGFQNGQGYPPVVPGGGGGRGGNNDTDTGGGSTSAVAASFSSPSGIAIWRDWLWWSYPNPIDPDLSLYRNGNGTLVLFVADTGNHCIRKIVAKEVYSNATTTGEKILKNVRVECFSGSCEHGTDASATIPQAGLADGNPYRSRFDSPRGLAVSNAGNVYVADTNNHIIRIIDRFGNTQTLAGTMTLAEKNDLGEPFEGCPYPCLAGVAGQDDGPFSSARFSYPSDVAIEQSRGRNSDEESILITDLHVLRHLNLIRKEVTTVAGQKGEGESDGEGNETSFNKPDGITVTADGFAYIVDSTSCRIRRASPQNFTVPLAMCNDTFSSMFRPSGCSSYDPQVDRAGMKNSPQSGNIYYNYRYRNMKHHGLGEHYIGRSIKECVGSPPPLAFDKKEFNESTLVVDNNLATAREDANEGSRTKVFCSSNCPSNYVYGIRLENNTTLYTENSTVCASAIHSGIHIDKSNGVVLDFENQPQISGNGNISMFRYSVKDGEDQYDYVDTSGQMFSLSLSSNQYLIQTISGHATSLLENSCGYHDSIPPQEAKVSSR